MNPKNPNNQPPKEIPNTPDPKEINPQKAPGRKDDTNQPHDDVNNIPRKSR